MDSQLLSLLSGELATLLPNAPNGAPGSTDTPDGTADFAAILGNALDGSALPDTDLAALLAATLPNMLMASPNLPPPTDAPAAVDAESTGGTGGSTSPLNGHGLPSLRLALLTPAVTTNKTSDPNIPDTTVGASSDETGDLPLDLNLDTELAPRPFDGATATRSEDAPVTTMRATMGQAFLTAATSANSDGAASQQQPQQQDKPARTFEEVLQFSAALKLDLAKGTNRDGPFPATQGAVSAAPSNDASAQSQPQSFAPALASVTNTAPAELNKASTNIAQPPNHRGWADAFSERVTFVVKQNFQEAELHLNPPQLGKIDVHITLDNDNANLLFSSPHGAVRDAIESSIPRLRDMLADSGFSLVNVDVSDKSLTQQRGNAHDPREFASGGSPAEYSAEFTLASNAPELLRANGRIDYYV